MSIITKIKSYICKVEWGVAIREKSVCSLFFEKNDQYFIPIPNNYHYWAADPFIIDFDNKTMLFVELYDRFKRKGLIGYMDLTSGVKTKFKTVFETNCHLSYPMCFIHRGDLYVIPESNNLKKLLILKWNRKNENFEEIQTFMEGYCLVDTNFANMNNECYMLATEITSTDNVGTLSIFKRIGEGAYKASPQNPVVKDKTIARNGGMVINYDNKLYRVSQDCGKGYGSGLNLMEINILSLDRYKETLIKKILPSDIKIKGVARIDGIHTYNSNGRYEVIDYKINQKFSLVEIIGFVLCKLQVFKKIEK